MNDKSADAKLFERKDVWHHMASLSYNELEMWLHVANNILQIFFYPNLSFVGIHCKYTE